MAWSRRILFSIHPVTLNPTDQLEEVVVGAWAFDPRARPAVGQVIDVVAAAMKTPWAEQPLQAQHDRRTLWDSEVRPLIGRVCDFLFFQKKKKNILFGSLHPVTPIRLRDRSPP